MGPRRDIKTLVSALVEDGQKVSENSIRTNALNWAWQRRAQEWDKKNDEDDKDRLAAERAETRRRHLGISTMLTRKALEALKATPISEMTPADVVRFLKLSTDLDRITLGQPTTSVAVSDPAGGPIRVEDMTSMTKQERSRRLAEIASELARRASVDAEDG